ncbi:MAG: ATP-binding protein [Candidatus Zixiibacteriota bacterium]
MDRLVTRIKAAADRVGAYTPFSSERDPGFREEVWRQAGTGLRMAGLLAVFGPTFGMVVSSHLIGQMPRVTRPVGDLQWAVWDELLIIAIGLGAIAWSKRHVRLRHARSAMSVLLLIMNGAMVADYLRAGYADLTAGLLFPFTILLLVTVGTMPFRGWHSVTLAMAMMVEDIVLTSTLPEAFGLPRAQISAEPYVTMSMLAFFGAGISALLYASRWRLYQVARRMTDSEVRYRNLFETATDGIFVIDNATGQFTQVNPSLCELVGLSVDEVRKLKFFEVVHPDDRERVKAYNQARREGKPAPSRYVIRAINRRQGEEPRVVELIFNRSQDTEFTRGAARDITDQVKADEKIRAYAQELEAKNTKLRETQLQLIQSEKMAALGTLVAGVAHEINTPIGSIHANADVMRRALEMLQEGLRAGDGPGAMDTSKIRRAAEALADANRINCTATERIIKIVRSLRTFARLDEAELNTVDLHEGLESTLTLVYHEYKGRVEIVRDYGALPPVSCYPNQINQVFMNILVNALHAIPQKGTITISTRQQGENVIISFTDTGIGIPRQNLPRIFDPGFTTKGVGVGTGLGLSIVYRIIEAHHGRIEVTSEVGKGSTFTIILPIRGPGETSDTAAIDV